MLKGYFIIPAFFCFCLTLSASALTSTTSNISVPARLAQNTFDPQIEDNGFLEEDDGSLTGDEFTTTEQESEPASETQEPAPTGTKHSFTKDNGRQQLGPSRKIFDWERHSNQSLVPHPFAEKGLVRINRDRHYFYRVELSEQRHAASLRFGKFSPENLENPDQAGQVSGSFEQNYDQTENPMVLFDYEWQYWRSPIGKVGVKAGTGVYLAQGNGHFVSSTNSGLVPRELFTFVAFPISAGAIYRMHLGKDKQLFVPYAEGGGSMFAFAELRDDDKPPKFGASPALYFGGGLAIDLTYFDYLSRVQLDREYGINAVYLNLEYRNVIALNQKFDFSADLMNAGFTLEF